MTLDEKIELANSLDEKKEEIKERFGFSDKEFNTLIKDVILDCFDKLKIRLSADDPIFAVVLSQKNVMDYYSIMITSALNNIPKQIGNAIDNNLDDFSEKIRSIGEAFDNELAEFKNGLSTQTLELNNQIITSFNKFIDEKINSIKNTLDSSNNQYSITQLPKNKKITSFITIFSHIMLMGMMLTIIYIISINNKNQERAYQMGLFKAFQVIGQEFDQKSSKKIESIIIDSIDKELSGGNN